jgi:alpha-1,2-mannosyltransferase
VSRALPRWALPALALLLALLAAAATDVRRTGWDFKAYRLCIDSIARGESPYLSDRVVDGIPYPCTYPPLAYDLARPFALVGPENGLRLWNASKAVVLLLLLLLWARLLPGGLGLPGALFILAAFGSPFWADFRCGNAAVFEQGLLWAGLAALVFEHDGLFVLCVAAAAQAKMLPAALLVLLLLRPKPRWGLFAGGCALFAGFWSLNRLLHGQMALDYLRMLSAPEKAWRWERGAGNASGYAFLTEWVDLLGVGGPARLRAALGSWALWTLGLLALSAPRLLALARRWEGDARARFETVALGTLLYALVVPRMKDYSYILLLPLALHALRCERSKVLRGLLLAAAMVASAKGLAVRLGLGAFAFTFEYFRLYTLLLSWAALARRREPETA